MSRGYISHWVAIDKEQNAVVQGNADHEVPESITPHNLLSSIIASIKDGLTEQGISFNSVVIKSISRL